MKYLIKSSVMLIVLIVSNLPGLAQAQESTPSDQKSKSITYGIVVDASKSIGSQFKDVIEAAKTIVNNNNPGDEAFLVRFVDSSNIETLQDFTSDKKALLDAISKLYTDLGQSAVIDAVYVSAQRVAQHNKRASDSYPALILITDGDDRASYYKQDQLFALLRNTKVKIFVIGLVNALDDRKVLLRKSSREKAIKLLQRLAQESGGRAFFIESTSELPGITDAIVSELRR